MIDRKKADALTSILGGLLGGAALTEMARQTYRGATKAPGALKNLWMKIGKAPGNIDALKQYADEVLVSGSKMKPKTRMVMLDKAIEEASEAVSAGKADMYTLANLLRERELMSTATSASDDVVSAFKRFATEHPYLTGMSTGGATSMAVNAMRDRGER
ncbi:MAG: hypothetical protein WC279_10040 [Sulfurimonas sp.]|jgi:hypothetical protein